MFKVIVGVFPKGIVVPEVMVNVIDPALVVLLITTEAKVTPEASMEVLAAREPSRVSATLAGKVEVLATVKLPATVIVGLAPVENVAVPLFVKELLKSKLVFPVMDMVPEFETAAVALATKEVMLFAVIVPALVKVLLTLPKLIVKVPVPAVIVPLLVRL